MAVIVQEDQHPVSWVEDELKGRLDWNLDDDELRIAVGALDDASDLAPTYGRDWPEDTAPRLVKTLPLKSAARYLRSPKGYTQSRAGDETLAWSNIGRDAGTVYFTRKEIRLLSRTGAEETRKKLGTNPDETGTAQRCTGSSSTAAVS
ncbi:hypothetical protein [Streptomyces doebereineriae]|uniref:Uncharacterized protein n=1 Tax=Streptomyces doebereineriae TaxID=3075528 RepID=A0ABU2VSB9_9ACTN|nr:hypothetical protein [Streptomyces sp. DSM 41640]MDT0487767.1 hypothetical protein [Streptomyces sp. DSM 41640]